ncbi:carboxypeptidase-like regulatory domain-containing protein [Geomonas paludis]|nr:carboxypeptidase-like regulatory domain-containing protein [Geomonas paludis]UPU35626.1 carboxypeptidase-like regulatory domain-containing protein [Geomonas paludis]
MTKLYLRTMIIFGAALLWASACFASGGKVTYPDGKPVVGAEVNVHLQDVDKYKLTTDANGRFSLPTMEFLDAFVQIKAPDGKAYATVNLPAKVFEAGDVAVVLQSKK